MNNHEKLSVIIPTFIKTHDELTQLKTAIKSVLDQNVECEILVVDDASPMAFEAIIHRDIGAEISVIRHHENGGASLARNTGMKNARHSVMTFLDSDDVLLPDTLRTRLNYALGDDPKMNIIENPQKIIGCGWREIKDNGALRQVRFAAPSTSPASFCRGAWFCPGSTVLLNRNFILDQLQGYDENMRRLEDADLFLRAGLAGAEYIPLPVIGAEILHHRKKSGQEIKRGCQLMEQKFLHSQALKSCSLTSGQQKLLKAYLAKERANAALIERDFLSLFFHGIRYLCLNPDRSPQWADQYRKLSAVAS